LPRAIDVYFYSFTLSNKFLKKILSEINFQLIEWNENKNSKGFLREKPLPAIFHVR